MTENEKVELLEAIKTEFFDNYNAYLHVDFSDESAEFLVNAVEKAIAKKPYKTTCPVCGADANDEYGHKKYCSNCGQKFSWE